MVDTESLNSYKRRALLAHHPDKSETPTYTTDQIEEAFMTLKAPAQLNDATKEAEADHKHKVQLVFAQWFCKSSCPECLATALKSFNCRGCPQCMLQKDFAKLKSEGLRCSFFQICSHEDRSSALRWLSRALGDEEAEMEAKRFWKQT